MPFYSGYSPFDDIVEKATAETNSTEDWGKIMDICDRVSRTSSGPKDALKSILKRVNHRIPQVSLQALTLLDACVNNCGKPFHLEVCSRDFVGEVRNFIKKLHRTASLKLKGMIKDWAKTFKDDPQLNLIPTLYEELKREKEEFPETQSANISLSSSTPAKKKTSSSEDDDLALAIQLSLSEAKNSQPKTQSLYPSISSSQSSTPKSKKVRALYDFEAAEDNELTFKTGDIISVTDSSDANWWKGELDGRSGLFPANFVTSDLTPQPKPAKKKGKKKKKKVSFSEKNSVKEFEASKALSEPLVISEEKIDQCLEMLKSASVEDEDEDDEGLTELEETCKKMAPLIANKIQDIQKRHDDLTDLSDDFLQTINVYQQMSKEPVRPVYSAVSQLPQYTGYTQPVMNSSTLQQPYGNYQRTQYAPTMQQQPHGMVVADGMGAAYSTPGPPNHPGYAAPINQGQYVPQLQQNVPYQASGPAPQEYSYPTSQVHGQYQPEYAATYSW